MLTYKVVVKMYIHVTLIMLVYRKINHIFKKMSRHSLTYATCKIKIYHVIQSSKIKKICHINKSCMHQSEPRRKIF